jgi:glucuronoxylan 4-O-methyltransferase
MTHYAELINKFKDEGKGLMSFNQYLYSALTTRLLAPCNFLVFGLGQDSPLWTELNEGGRTVFLEDDAEWISQFDDQELEIYNVEYQTKAENYKSIGYDPEILQMDLPATVRNTQWDLIFVDGPLGHNPPTREFKGPGRMQSIFTAHQLLKDGGICIFDDIGRDIESTYANHYFGQENCLLVIEEKLAVFKKAYKKG